MMTREEWLRHAVEEIDFIVFGNDLNLTEHQFQITCGKCGGRRQTETIQPTDGEDVSLDDFFPTTISVDHKIKEPMDMLVALTFECIHAFFNIKGTNKRFKKLAEKYFFEAPYKEPHPSDELVMRLKTVLENLESDYGDFPGVPVVIHPKEKKDKKKTSYTVFCPNCGLEMKINRKMLDKHGRAMPTCPCGAKMGLDLEDEETEQTEEQN